MQPMQQIKNILREVREFEPRVLALTSQNHVLLRTEMITRDTEYNQNSIYLGHLSQVLGLLRFLKGITLFLIEDTERIDQSKTYGNMIVCFPESTNLEKLYSSCDQFIRKHEDLMEDSYLLMDSFLSAKGIDEIVETASQMINNPIMIIDNSYKIITSSKSCISNDFQWKQNIERGYCSFEYVAIFNKLEDIRNDNPDQPFTSGCLSSPLRHCITKLSVGRDQYGYLLSIESNSDFTDRQLRFLQIAGRFLSKMFALEQKGDNRIISPDYSGILRDSLDESFKSRDMLLEGMKVAGFNIDSSYYIMVVDISHYNIRDYYSESLREHILKIFPKSMTVNFRQNVVTLIDSRLSDDKLMVHIQKYQDYFQEQGLKVGISDCFYDIYQIREYYLQAGKAVEIGLKMSVDKDIICYNDVRCYDLLLAQVSQANAERYIDNACRKVMAYDKEHNTNYFVTMYNYIISDRSIRLAAEKMFMHKNTITYRIAKIKELFDIDVNSTETGIKIYYSYILMQMKENGMSGR